MARSRKQENQSKKEPGDWDKQRAEAIRDGGARGEWTDLWP